MRLAVAASCLLLASTALPQLAHAGMSNRDATPVYRPEPCQGLICSFASAKALLPPVTAAQAAEAQQKATAETVTPTETAPPAVEAASATRRVERVARSDAPSVGAMSSKRSSGHSSAAVE